MRTGLQLRALIGVLAALAIVASGCGGGGGGGDGNGGGTATVEGIVCDDGTLQPVAGATVSIGGSQAVTGDDGSFSLQAQAGVRTVTISADGYVGSQTSETLSVGANDLGTRYLQPELQSGYGAVSGTVRSNGTGASDAIVRSGTARATTRSDGSYTAYNVQAGERGLTALSADGTATGSAVATVEDGSTVTGVDIDLGLAPPAPPAL